MPCGELQLVAYGEENQVLNEKPQITFFKIVYRRYTNFSIETIQTNFLYQPEFSKRYSVELSKIGDLLHQMWIVVELPDIPVIYSFDNVIDKRIKFKWSKKIAYMLIKYIEIEIGGQVVDKQWGEWMNVLNEINWNNFNSSLDEYIGNVPELTTYKFLASGVNSYKLHIPLFFWFSKNSGLALPLLCFEYGIVRLNVQFNDFENCAIFSPSNFVQISKYYGYGILGEPLIQYSPQGIAWGEFDSIDINSYDAQTLNINSYNLYYRKISDNQIITTTEDYYQNSSLKTINMDSPTNYFIYGLLSGSIYIPVHSNTNDATSIYIQQIYNYIIAPNISFKNVYLLSNYVYLDREERTKFFQNKHEYVIEQVYYSGTQTLTNLNNKNYLELINPCKYIIFMAQVKYFLNPNVNESFNYNIHFFDPIKMLNQTLFKNKSVINKAGYAFDSISVEQMFEMEYYNYLVPFANFPTSKIPQGFGILSFALYPTDLQPSGSCNMSAFNTFQINTTFNPVDINYNNYIFKTYTVTYNYLKIVEGVAAPIFISNL